MINRMRDEQHIRDRQTKASKNNVARETRFAKSLYRDLSAAAVEVLKGLLRTHGISVKSGDVKFFDGCWYVTHSGLLRIAERRRCVGIHVQPMLRMSAPSSSRWTFKACVFKSLTCKGFEAFGDADASNTTPLVHGAEMRIAETRAVNRALRKAYGIGLCSAEEIGTSSESRSTSQFSQKIPPQPVNGHSHTTGLRVRDRLCQLIRQHQLDPNLVKSYAMDFCGAKVLRDATREQLEKFVTQLGDQAARDLDVLLNQLNSYRGNQESAA